MHLIKETSVLPVNRPSNFEKLAEDISRSLLDWIQANMVLTKTFDPRHDSYTLKHQFERDTGHYVDNGEFKGAIRHLGFEPKDLAHGINWVFRARLKRKTKRRNDA
jgi:hypothetical protein